MAFFCCALLVAGLPPLPGFVAKLSLLSAALQTSATDTPSLAAWTLVAAVLLSGLAGIIALSRTGIRLFWAAEDIVVPRLRVSEAGSVSILLLSCIALAIWAGPVMDFLEETALMLDRPQSYIDAVMSHQPVRPLGGMP